MRNTPVQDTAFDDQVAQEFVRLPDTGKKPATTRKRRKWRSEGTRSREENVPCRPRCRPRSPCRAALSTGRASRRRWSCRYARTFPRFPIFGVRKYNGGRPIVVRRGSRKEETMPIYEYECRQCKQTFTEKQTFQEHDRHGKVKCPKCGTTGVQQVISHTFAKTSKKS